MGGILVSVIADYKEALKYKYVIGSFVTSNLKVRYRRSVLGYIWTVLVPIFQYGVIAIVLSQLARSAADNYFGNFFAGAILFGFFSAAIGKSTLVFLSNEHYLKKVAIPKLVYILSDVFYELANFLISFLTIFLVGVIFGVFKLELPVLFLPFALILFLVFILGIVKVLAVAGVFFRDLKYIVPVLMQATFFMTPIAYTIEQMPQKFQFIIALNPVYYFLEIIRLPIVHGLMPDGRLIMICVLISLISFFVGRLFLKKFENKVIFKL